MNKRSGNKTSEKRFNPSAREEEDELKPTPKDDSMKTKGLTSMILEDTEEKLEELRWRERFYQKTMSQIAVIFLIIGVVIGIIIGGSM